MLQVRDTALEQKILAIMDSQGRDIAVDFTGLDKKVQSLKREVEKMG